MCVRYRPTHQIKTLTPPFSVFSPQWALDLARDPQRRDVLRGASAEQASSLLLRLHNQRPFPQAFSQPLGTGPNPQRWEQGPCCSSPKIISLRIRYALRGDVRCSRLRPTSLFLSRTNGHLYHTRSYRCGSIAGLPRAFT